MSDERKSLPRGIHQRPDGRFRLYVTQCGKPYQPLVTWELLTELGVKVPETTRLSQPGLELASKALIKLQNARLDNEKKGAVAASASAKTKIGDLFKLIEQDYLRTGRKSLDDVLTRWSLHLKGPFADVAAAALGSDHINAYIFRRQREGASGASINRELAIIRRMMRLGERQTPPLVRGIPYFPKLAESDPRTAFLEQHEYDKLKLHAHPLWLRALLATYYTFGFRRNELLKLRVRQVSLIDDTINLPAGATKTSRPRTLVMTGEVLALVSALIHGKAPNDFVFTHDEHEQRAKGGSQVVDFRGAWKKMFADAGVEPRRLHDMRRSAIRNALRRGVDRDTVKKMSGHLTDHVFSAYNIQAVDDLRKAAEKIEQGAALVRTRTATKTATGGQAHAEAVQ